MDITRSVARAPGWRALAALTLLGAAAIHVAVTPGHFDEWFAAGVFFIVLAVAEVAAAVLILSMRHGAKPATLWVVAALSAGTIALWVVSRTVGLPFGPEAGTPEAVGVWDVTSTALEGLTLLALWGLAQKPPYRAAHAMDRDAEGIRHDRAA